jgi:hypothetical protein
MTHTPGGGGIAVRPTDMARFEYLLLHERRWHNHHQPKRLRALRDCIYPLPSGRSGWVSSQAPAASTLNAAPT